MEDCIFCKIAAGIIPSACVYEDEDFKAILDIAPAAKGHVLLLPKKHFADLLELDPEVGKKALFVASKIASAQKKALKTDGINLLQNSGEAAGQTIFHFHMHLIPRYENDNLTIPGENLSYAEGEAAEYAAKIRSCM